MRKHILGILIAASLRLALAPAFADADFDRGVKLYNQRDFQNAVTCLDNAINANPKNSPAYYYKALALQQSGDVAGAVQVYTTIKQNFPGTQEATFAARVLDHVKKNGMPAAKAQPHGSNSPTSDVSHDPDYSKVETANASEDELSKLPDETRVPFTRGPEGHLMVNAFVNNRPMQVMFDTGAAGCLFGQNQFTQAGVTNVTWTKGTTAVGGVGSNIQNATAALVDLKLGDISRKMPVMVMHHLDAEPLLGQTFYNGYHYDIDNTAGIIRFVKKTSARKNSYTTFDTVDIPFKTVGNNMVVTVKVNGHDCPMYFDTGAYGVAMDYFTGLTLGLRVGANSRPMVSGGVGGASQGIEVEAERIELGSIMQQHCPVTLLLNGAPPIPLLGQSFFKNRRFTIDNEKHLIRFSR